MLEVNSMVVTAVGGEALPFLNQEINMADFPDFYQVIRENVALRRRHELVGE